jgi:hypothetical protein
MLRMLMDATATIDDRKVAAELRAMLQQLAAQTRGNPNISRSREGRSGLVNGGSDNIRDFGNHIMGQKWTSCWPDPFLYQMLHCIDILGFGAKSS